MSWVKKRVLLTVKAYPTESTKYGATWCAAGVTDDGEWIRLYPMPLDMVLKQKRKFKRYNWIEVECKKATEKLSRKESYKVRSNSIRIIDPALTEPPIDWDSRNEILTPMLDSSVKSLQEKWEDDRTSLGFIHPRKVADFVLSKVNEEDKDAPQMYQMDLEGNLLVTPEKMIGVCKYNFTCSDDRCTGHLMTCLDWELGECWRKWRSLYPTIEERWVKIKDRFFKWMLTKRDLHFYMGMHSQWPVWMIIGIYYPPA